MTGVSLETELRLRRLMLALLSFGLVAVCVELFALGHDEEALQLIPIGAIVATLAIIGWHVAAGGAGSLQALRAVMLVMIVTGVAGIVLHFRGNMEFQLEINPNLGAWELFLKVLHAKAPPALAPGVMAQLGLLGLIYTYRHPAGSRRQA